MDGAEELVRLVAGEQEDAVGEAVVFLIVPLTGHEAAFGVAVGTEQDVADFVSDDVGEDGGVGPVGLEGDSFDAVVEDHHV